MLQRSFDADSHCTVLILSFTDMNILYLCSSEITRGYIFRFWKFFRMIYYYHFLALSPERKPSNSEKIYPLTAETPLMWLKEKRNSVCATQAPSKQIFMKLIYSTV